MLVARVCSIRRGWARRARARLWVWWGKSPGCALCSFQCVRFVFGVGCGLTSRACRWGLGPFAVRKKQLISEGKLDKHGKPNENTPAEYLRALATAGTPAAVTAVIPAVKDTAEPVRPLPLPRLRLAAQHPLPPIPFPRRLVAEWTGTRPSAVCVSTRCCRCRMCAAHTGAALTVSGGAVICTRSVGM